MAVEIVQPNIRRPDPEDRYAMASFSRIHAEWIRTVGPQLDIDVPIYILGHVLGNIIGDDAHCFSWALGGRIYEPTTALQAKKSLLERMDWEAGVPETPQDIKDMIIKARRKVASFKWSTKRSFYGAMANWYMFKGRVEEQIKKQPNLKTRNFTCYQCLNEHLNLGKNFYQDRNCS